MPVPGKWHGKKREIADRLSATDYFTPRMPRDSSQVFAPGGRDGDRCQRPGNLFEHGGGKLRIPL
jgi:hypothetical protein